jgi:hypothetical protein
MKNKSGLKKTVLYCVNTGFVIQCKHKIERINDMNKKDLLEIRRRFTKESTSIDYLAGCYVDSSKNKVCTFKGSFLNLADEEFFKYLDIAKKSLSGTIGNNIIEYEFPVIEEAPGGRQQILMALRDNPKDDNLLNAYYDHVIDTYDTVENYLILVYHDSYDVIVKSSDNKGLDESEETYTYIIVAICPVALDKPALCYNENTQAVESKERDWVVGVPETAVLFPSFTERSTDIHFCTVYSKNPKESHKEFVENGLGCEAIKTTDEIREEFYDIVRKNFDNEEAADKAILSITKDIHDVITSQYEEGQRNVSVSADDISSMISDDHRFTDEVVDKITKAYSDKFDEDLSTEVIIDEKLLRKNEEALQILELEDTVAELNLMLNSMPSEKIVEIKAPNEVSDKIVTKEIDGVRYVLIPADIVDITVNKISIN